MMHGTQTPTYLLPVSWAETARGKHVPFRKVINYRLHAHASTPNTIPQGAGGVSLGMLVANSCMHDYIPNTYTSGQFATSTRVLHKVYN